MTAPYESVQTVSVRVRDTDDPTKVETQTVGGAWLRYRVESNPYRLAVIKEAIDAHVASRPQPDPAWGTREEVGEWVGLFTPDEDADTYPWRARKNTDRETSWLSREQWADIKREALS